MTIKICVITEKRTDAINIVNEALIDNLRIQKKQIKVISFNNKPFSLASLNFLIEIINTIRLIFLIDKEDTLLFTDPLSFNTLASLFVHNKKYVVFYHYEKDPFYYKVLPSISYSTVLNSFDGIMCISKFTFSQLKTLHINIEKCKVVYCGVDHKLFKPSLCRLFDYDYILSVGSEEPRKNMKNIMKTMQILRNDYPNIKLLKVGKANDQNRKRTISYVKKYGLSECVIFTDYVEEADLPKVYSGAQLLLFPSLLEGFGLPVVEAMSCGCPVVTSNINPMKELVGVEQKTVNPNKPIEMAAECKKILQNNKYRNTIIRNGLKRGKMFNWTTTAKEVLKFIGY